MLFTLRRGRARVPLLFVVIYGGDGEGSPQVDTQNASSFLKVVIRSRKDLESVYGALYSRNLESPRTME